MAAGAGLPVRPSDDGYCAGILPKEWICAAERHRSPQQGARIRKNAEMKKNETIRMTQEFQGQKVNFSSETKSTTTIN